MRRRATCIVAIMVLFAAAACSGSPDAATTEPGPIKIGQVVSLTGSYLPLGTENQKSVALAVGQINAKGVLGRKIELIVKDDKSQPDQALLAFNELKDSGVVAVIGSPFSNSALATIPQVDRDRILYVSLTPADEQINPVHPYVFVVPATSGTYAERMLQYFKATGVTKVAVAYDSKSSYATAGFKGMQAKASQYGVTLVAVAEFQTSATEFSAVIAHVKSSRAQAFAVWATGAPAVALTKQYAIARVDVPLVLTGAQASTLFLAPAGPAAEGVTILSSIGVVGSSLPNGPLKTAVDDLTTSFLSKYGYAPPQFSHDGYTGMKLLVAAIEQAGGTDRDRIRDALETLTLVTPNGTYKYSAADHGGLAKEFISVNVVQNGAFVPTEWAKAQLGGLTGA